jgi:hypothetical protein
MKCHSEVSEITFSEKHFQPAKRNISQRNIPKSCCACVQPFHAKFFAFRSSLPWFQRFKINLWLKAAIDSSSRTNQFELGSDPDSVSWLDDCIKALWLVIDVLFESIRDSLGPVYEFVCVSFTTGNLNCFRVKWPWRSTWHMCQNLNPGRKPWKWPRPETAVST